jgi:hypothetical protein
MCLGMTAGPLPFSDFRFEPDADIFELTLSKLMESAISESVGVAGVVTMLSENFESPGLWFESDVNKFQKPTLIIFSCPVKISFHGEIEEM